MTALATSDGSRNVTALSNKIAARAARGHVAAGGVPTAFSSLTLPWRSGAGAPLEDQERRLVAVPLPDDEELELAHAPFDGDVE